MTDKLRGFIQSGIIVVLDPVYLSGSLAEPGSEELEDPLNPFMNFPKFTDSLHDQDANLPFPGAFEEHTTGRGIAIQTGRLSGQYELVKEYGEDGRLSQIRIVFRD